ncbi:DUF1802 family protein [Hassallia byssoidea VB512170]|uniref:DUF1802 family protein n=1 Tax=Hassallia byssoidea VB512170 TaxID=1304833 RepID=A0A846HH29_9CYAN|nr:DUF1802 family protein [Hassalia byssoidea]NEU76393.1 DUF1802 family protein [Hassalia byssoidea VB512170]
MNQQTLIPTALCLPTPDIEALIQGRTIVALPRMFIRPGQQFSLYPANYSTIPLSVERYYRSNFLPIAQTAFKLLSSEKVLIKAWAKCELCQILDETKSLEVLSGLTIWTKEGLQEIIRQRQHIFITYLRVYQLLYPQEVSVNPNIQEKVGKFVSLPLTVSDAKPVLSDRLFNIRKHQLQNLHPPLHPELEQLQSALSSLATTNPAAKQLEQDIKVFLGWSSEQFVKQIDSNLSWINDIAKLGDRSRKEDEGKSNYQAGTEFENIVRDSLEFLGFSVDYSHKGGAGGLDLFCSKPYPLFGECKAGKKIPNDTAVQLLNLGTLRRPDLFNQATKLIIGPGEPTNQLKDAAKLHGMAIINPETLEKLIKLQSNYRNSIDLFQLKEYLKAGQSDEEVEKYIDQVYTDMKQRSQIVQALKELSEQDNENSKTTHNHFTVTEIRAHYNATQKPKLTDETVHDLVIELSSPLTGYLGRIKGNDWRSDRFYFLRDLPTS